MILMALEKSDAIVLKAYNWAESSRTIIFFTKKYGKLALFDKGGRSIKTKRGRIIPFAPLELTFYNSEKETTGYISDIDIRETFSFEKDGTLGRLAYASAGAELLMMLLPEEEPQRQLFSYYINYLQYIDRAGKQFIPALFITFFLRLLSQLGYHPSIKYCITCNIEIALQNSTPIMFGADIGGTVCETCQKAGDYYISFSPEMFKIFASLQTASLQEAATVPIGLSQVTILQEALIRFISTQMQKNYELKSLAFIEKLKNSNTK